MKVSILASVIWLLYTILLRVPKFIFPPPGPYIAAIIAAVVFFVVPVVNHIGMLLAIRRHNSQLGDAVASQQMSAVLQREKKVAFDMVVVTIMLLALLVPSFLMKIIELPYPRVHSIVSPWCFTLGFMTSSINPLFYIGRNKNLRNAVKSLLCSK